MAECIIKKCTCKSEYQDKTYGQNMRVYNPLQSKNKIEGYRCSVCGKEISAK